MRKFYLELKDAKGNPRTAKFPNGRVNLQFDSPSQLNYLFSSPEGLGYENGHNYSYLGDGFYKNVEHKIPQQTISGKLIIRQVSEIYDGLITINNIYSAYSKIFNEIEYSSKFYVVYAPYDSSGREYRREVEILSVGKSEISTNEVLEVPISFKTITPWFLRDDSVDMQSDLDRVMRYTYTYTPDLIYGALNDCYRGIVVNEGSLPAAVIIRINGVKRPYNSFGRPYISLIDSETAEELGQCRFGIDLYPNESFEMSSLPNDSYVKKINSDGTEENLINSVSIETDPFIRIPPGKQCEIIVGSGLHNTFQSRSVVPASVDVTVFHFTRVV